MDCRRWIVLAFLAAVGSCTPPPAVAPQDKDLYAEFERERAAHPELAESATPPNPGMPMLQVIATDQTSSGEVMMFRGELRNPLYEKVTGARLIVHVVTLPSQGTKELDTKQKEMSATIPSGGSIPLRWDIESMYWGSSPMGFRIEAYPKKVGDRVIPPPPGWRE